MFERKENLNRHSLFDASIYELCRIIAENLLMPIFGGDWKIYLIFF